tara:strand:+ start:2545 stop:3489 length:945 start_codon:yes stop_codon:yes gene_type:complete
MNDDPSNIPFTTPIVPPGYTPPPDMPINEHMGNYMLNTITLTAAIKAGQAIHNTLPTKAQVGMSLLKRYPDQVLYALKSGNNAMLKSGLISKQTHGFIKGAEYFSPVEPTPHNIKFTKKNSNIINKLYNHHKNYIHAISDRPANYGRQQFKTNQNKFTFKSGKFKQLLQPTKYKPGRPSKGENRPVIPRSSNRKVRSDKGKKRNPKQKIPISALIYSRDLTPYQKLSIKNNKKNNNNNKKNNNNNYKKTIKTPSGRPSVKHYVKRINNKRIYRRFGVEYAYEIDRKNASPLFSSYNDQKKYYNKLKTYLKNYKK